jgi:Flp pilus assembly protein TadB
MATKKATTAKKSSKTSKSAKTSKKVVRQEPSLPQRVSTFFSSLRSKTISSDKPTKSRFVSRKFFLPVLGLLVLLALAYLASRFLVVAWVDNKPLTRFAYYSQLDQKYGKDLREL